MLTTTAQINYRTIKNLGLIATSFLTGQIQSSDTLMFNIRAAGYADSSFIEISTCNSLVTLFADHTEQVAHVGRVNDQGVIFDSNNSTQCALDAIALSLLSAVAKNNPVIVFDDDFQAVA